MAEDVTGPRSRQRRGRGRRRDRDIGGCPCGGTPSRRPCRRARRSPRTSTSTSASSAPASPDCGRPSRWPWRIPPCASRCSNTRSPGSAPRVGTAAGARRCSRRPMPRSPVATGPTPCAPCGVPCSDTVDEVGDAAAGEGIDCHFAKGGTVDLVRSEAQAARATRRGRRGPVARFRRGRSALARRGRDDRTWSARRVSSARRSHRTVRRSSRPSWPGAWPTRSSGVGVRLYEHTEVSTSHPREGSPPSPAARCGPPSSCGRPRPGPPTLPGSRRDLVPVYSLMVATEPLGAAFWDAAGLDARQTFADHRHMIIYGQRTADGPHRLRWAGCAVPLRLGRAPAVRPRSRRARAPARDADRALPRAWPGSASPTPGADRSASRGTGTPSVGFDRATGLAWAGGYVGDGVATTNLAGRTLADLITGATPT